MAIDYNPNTAFLTPPVRHLTAVAAPTYPTYDKSGKLVAPAGESATDTVVAHVCSEFTSIRMPTRVVEGNHKLALAWAAQGQSVIFSIGADHVSA